MKIHLVYYPPYHSKYNPIERCWAALENYWNGAILDSIETAISWASNMRWKGIAPIVHLLDNHDDKGIKVSLPIQVFAIEQLLQTMPPHKAVIETCTISG